MKTQFRNELHYKQVYKNKNFELAAIIMQTNISQDVLNNVKKLYFTCPIKSKHKLKVLKANCFKETITLCSLCKQSVIAI